MACTRLISGAALIAISVGVAGCGEEPAGDEAASVAGPEPAVIDERQANFKSLGKSFKAIRTQLEGGSPDMTVIATAATEMNATALKLESQFPEGTSVDDGFDTEALSNIWDDPEKFTEAHKRLADATAEMITIAEGGDAAAVGDQVGAIGGSCKNCHDTFRLDTD